MYSILNSDKKKSPKCKSNYKKYKSKLKKSKKYQKK